MDLTVLDTNFSPIYVMDSYESLIWTDRYNTCGDFEIYTPVTDKILEYFKQGYYLQNSESDHTMIIEKLQISGDAEEGSKIQITGNSLESILDRRIAWGPTTLDGSFQVQIKSLLDACLINPENTDRKVDNITFQESTDSRITSLEINAQYTGDSLYEIITGACSERNLGFKMVLDAETKNIVFSLYMGDDHSYSQSANPYVVFSPVFNNLTSSNYIESKSNLKNVALIGGEGEGSERFYASVGDSTGLERRELFVDAKDISTKGENDTTLSEDEYVTLLGQRGEEKLNEYSDVQSFEGEAEVYTSFRYKKDFFMGDVVQIEDEYGHTSQSRVLEVVISDSTSGFLVYPTFSAIDGTTGTTSAIKDPISGSGSSSGGGGYGTNVYVSDTEPTGVKTGDVWIDTTKTEASFDTIYPVGSIYMSINATNPKDLFGIGTWEQIKGRFLLGVGAPSANTDTYFGNMSGTQYNASAQSMGGQDYHTLTADEMPSHRHDGLYYYSQTTDRNISLNGGSTGYKLNWVYSSGNGNAEIMTGNAGSGTAHNNMPPYFAVYIWYRVA